MKGQVKAVGPWGVTLNSKSRGCVGQAEEGVASNMTSCGATHSARSAGTKQDTDSAQTGQDLPKKQQAGIVPGIWARLIACIQQGTCGSDITRRPRIIVTMTVALLVATLYTCCFWYNSFITLCVSQLRKPSLVQVLSKSPSQADTQHVSSSGAMVLASLCESKAFQPYRIAWDLKVWAHSGDSDIGAAALQLLNLGLRWNFFQVWLFHTLC